VLGYALNPDTLELERMTKAEADELDYRYWARKPAKRTLEAAQRKEAPARAALEQGAEKAVKDAQRKAVAAVQSAAQRAVTRTVTPSVLKSAGAVVAKATLVGAAGLAAYYITSKLRTIRYKTYADLRYDASNQYRQARQAAALQAGRALTAAELGSLSEWYKAKLRHLDEAERSGRSVSGISNLIFGD